ncbi:NAD(P)/FAD-dependent oxidoreductase [Macromonas nakdongensis]|uniref:NAD(P)/FAD-dependent oxidoreductase n=1 Tax=Macromonas nakdongensis TaxID=1843082 RepID=UPI000C323DEF|nr:NAD(P)/FAD-dependent oxidoreductase [Macromonas nakdongensis]
MPVIDTQALVVGAGPVGLFQAFQLGLQEVDTHLVDALPHPGGQCAELYPDKPIYDIPGLPVCSGQELTQRLLAQIAPFRQPLHLGQQVQTLSRQADGRFALRTNAGLEFRTHTVFIAAGVGAFVPRKPALVGLEAHEGQQVHYHGPDSTALQGQHVVVMGGEDAALDAVLGLWESGTCASLTLLHRTDKFKASPEQEARVRQALATGGVRLVLGQPVGLEVGPGGRLTALQVATPADSTERLPLDALLPRLGLSPKLGPLADWGLAMERKLLPVATDTFATSEPGVFAVGDVNTYPGKRKLILCGFHEATLAAFAAAALVHPERRVLLQYTTTSPRLHELLGVAGSPSP